MLKIDFLGGGGVPSKGFGKGIRPRAPAVYARVPGISLIDERSIMLKSPFK